MFSFLLRLEETALDVTEEAKLVLVLWFLGVLWSGCWGFIPPLGLRFSMPLFCRKSVESTLSIFSISSGLLLLMVSKDAWIATTFLALLIVSTSLGDIDEADGTVVTAADVAMSESFFFDFLAPVDTLLAVWLPEITVVVAVGAFVGCGSAFCCNWPALITGLTLPVEEVFGSWRLLLFAVTVGAALAGLTVFSSAG